MYSQYPQSLSEAKELKSTKYFSGIPCPKGHIALRRTSNSACVECQSEKAKTDWAAGKRKTYSNRTLVNTKWNSSSKAYLAKQKWKNNDPKRAWCVSAVGGAKTRAKDNGLIHTITWEYVYLICPDVCPVFGTSFVFIGSKSRTDESPSIDRINPHKGYVEGNVMVISMKANMIKNAYNSDEIQQVATWLRNIENTTDV